LFSRAAAFAAAVMAFVLAPALVGAHEVRDVADGQYRMVVGFLNEPVSVGDKSGLDLRVTEPGGAGTPAAEGEEEFVPVEGLETSLQAEVFYGDQMMALTIEPRFRDPGAYASYFYPNAAGDYSFRIFGTIEGVAIDETFSTGPDTFGAVEERLLFPPDTTSAGTGSAGVTSAGIDLTGGLPGGVLGMVAMLAAGIVVVVGMSRRTWSARSRTASANADR
jgi:hypothetical protein